MITKNSEEENNQNYNNKNKNKSILISFDSFKDCLSSFEIGKCVDKSLKDKYCDEKIETEILKISDGGEALLECLESSLGLKLCSVDTKEYSIIGPLGSVIEKQFVHYAINEQERYAVIEMAEVSGIQLVPTSKRSPFNTTTYGTGQLIKHAIEVGGFSTIYIGAGGSATNDAGLGAIQALGVIDIIYNDSENENNKNNNNNILFGKDLNRIKEIKIMNKLKYKDVKFHFLTDVRNPMIGERGAVYSFSEQKGAKTKEDKEKLERGMINVLKHLPVDISKIEGSGAAGGLPSSFLSIFNETTQIINGMDFVCRSYGLDEKFQSNRIQLIITGEGCFDQTTLDGKVVSKMYYYSKTFNVNLLIICGKNNLLQQSSNPFSNDYSPNIQIYDLVSQFGIDNSLNNTKHCIETLFKENENLTSFLNKTILS
ncbi:hypothetical protein RB653_003010 [Dictyostelium firmibasis]|uniref:Glycerate kinase n=1 Tax=Dictyostelium firmibasis TaxID=79012 RepID=A0AAN7YNJ5_9MYCE